MFYIYFGSVGADEYSDVVMTLLGREVREKWGYIQEFLVWACV